MHLLILGHGYSASFLSPRLLAKGWTVAGTTRSEAAGFGDARVEQIIWPGDSDALRHHISRADAILTSVAPDSTGDPVLREFAQDLSQAAPKWVGYLSSTNVYGGHGGAWVDETTEPSPSSARARARVEAEAAWADLSHRAGWPLNIFRLAGIYGPGRGPFAKLRAGTARCIVKPGQIFSRIHAEDIAGALETAITRAIAGQAVGVEIFNLCDDQPAPPQETIRRAAEMLGLPTPPEEPFEHAEMSAMARSFYADSKRVRNDRMKTQLGYHLGYPDLDSGLTAILEAEKGTEATE